MSDALTDSGLRRLAEKIGERWQIVHQKGEFNDAYWIGPEEFFSIAQVRNGAEDDEYGGDEMERARAEFIAACHPQAILALLDRVEALEKEALGADECGRAAMAAFMEMKERAETLAGLLPDIREFLDHILDLVDGEAGPEEGQIAREIIARIDAALHTEEKDNDAT